MILSLFITQLLTSDNNNIVTHEINIIEKQNQLGLYTIENTNIFSQH